MPCTHVVDVGVVYGQWSSGQARPGINSYQQCQYRVGYQAFFEMAMAQDFSPGRVLGPIILHTMLTALKAHAKLLKQHTLTVYFAARDPRTPILVRVLAILVAAYALSPIDLIPDFIPVIGYLDDLLIVPLGLALVVRLTPPEVLESARAKAQQTASKPVSYAAAACFVVLWLVVAWLGAQWLVGVFRS